MPPQLDFPPIPYELDHIWNWWIELDKTRQVGMEECSITYSEIESWSRLLKIDVTPFEVQCLIGIDSLAAASRSRSREAARKAAQNK